MVISPMVINIVTINFIAVAVLLLAAFAEHLHARRVQSVSRLAFGPTGRPVWWARAAPTLRACALALTTWGALILWQHDPIESDEMPDARASRQLLVVLDVSPSMNLEDAGPRAEKVSRGAWAGEVLQGILDRIDMKDTRISMIAFYTKAVVMLHDSSDKRLVSGLMDGLPLYTAFTAGETDLQAGLDEAFTMARGWARASTTLVVISDGDLTKPVIPTTRPASIADAIVIGVGDPNRATSVSGHSSRQDEWALKSLAGKLDGYYHQGNTKHLPSEVVNRLTMIAPRVSDSISMREAGLIALGLSGAVLGLLGPALMRFGVAREYRVALRGPRIARTTSATSRKVSALGVSS